jgi:hypothetical protein
MERVRRKRAVADDGNRQMVNILTAVLTDGLPAVEAACAEALNPGVIPPALSSTSWLVIATPARRSQSPNSLVQPHDQVTGTPEHNPVDRRDRPFLHQAYGSKSTRVVLRERLGLVAVKTNTCGLL